MTNTLTPETEALMMTFEECFDLDFCDDYTRKALAAREKIRAKLLQMASLTEALEKMVHAATYATFDHADAHPLPVARAAILAAKAT